MYRFTTLLSILILSCSCVHSGLTDDRKSEQAALPRNTKNIVDLGNNWVTFDLDIEGKTRCFIYHKSYEGFGEISYGFEAISELDACKR